MKRALVTGGSKGIGLAVCQRLAEQGWAILSLSRSSSAGFTELTRTFPRVAFRPTDLSDTSQVATLCAELSRGEPFDALIANAGIGTEGLLTLIPEQEIARCLQVNLVTVVLLTRALVKGMLLRGGSVVYLSSVCAIRGYAGLSVYSATKAALLGFARSLAREYGIRKIRFNCVLPGFIETEMTQCLSEKERERIRRRTPLDRFGRTADVAAIVQYLLSDEAQFITGAEFVVDGGSSS